MRIAHITKTCVCGKAFSGYPSVISKRIFCGKACHDESQSRKEVKTIECQHCHNEFEAKQDHGRWPKFCGRACYGAKAPIPKEKECPSCGIAFLATRSSHSEDRLREYCSAKCRHEGKKTGVMAACKNCGEPVYQRPSAIELGKGGCCSEKCQREFYIGENSKGWKGGKYTDTATGCRQVLIRREGFVGRYAGEHRLVASMAIGRNLETHEPVLHINNIKSDNSHGNLFICGSRSECNKRLIGVLAWPKRSNLNSYK